MERAGKTKKNPTKTAFLVLESLRCLQLTHTAIILQTLRGLQVTVTRFQLEFNSENKRRSYNFKTHRTRSQRMEFWVEPLRYYIQGAVAGTQRKRNTAPTNQNSKKKRKKGNEREDTREREREGVHSIADFWRMQFFGGKEWAKRNPRLGSPHEFL